MKSNVYYYIFALLCVLSAVTAEESSSADSHQLPYDGQYPIVGENHELDPDSYDGFVFGYDEYPGMDPESDRHVATAMDKALAAIYGIITIVGLISNGVVFFVIFGRNEINKTVTAMYVVQLAVADSAFLFSLPIFGMQKVTGSWTFGSATCTICQGIKFLNYYAGIFFLTAMSVDRYIAVAYSTKAHQLRTKIRTIIACIIVWSLSAVMAFPILLFSKTENVAGAIFCRLQFPGYVTLNESETYLYVFINHDYHNSSNNSAPTEYYYGSGDASAYEDYNFTEYEDQDYSPHFDPKLNKTYEEHYMEFTLDDNVCTHGKSYTSFQTWLVVNFLIGFLLPFLVITISYVLILMRLRTSEAKIANMTGKRTQNMRRRVTRTVAGLVICFVICWLPYNVFLLLKIKGLRVPVSTCDGLEQFFVALAFSNSAVNPILYTFLGHNFRERLTESINYTKRRFRRGSMGSASAHFTRSHSDQGNISLTKKIGNMVGFRRSSRAFSGHEVGGANDQNPKTYQAGKKLIYGIPLLDLHGKKKEQKSGWNYKSEQNDHTECRSHSNQTECTRVMLDRDTRNDGPYAYMQ